MYTRCIYCQTTLGANEDVELFPVGKRLAFDPAKGRLWVVCPSCFRWNLTPLEERWEAVETCERLFRGTLLRLSTDEIGLATLGSGLELVRIGKPLRPEFAAWRYGARFARRRRRYLVRSTIATASHQVSEFFGELPLLLIPVLFPFYLARRRRRERRLAAVVARVALPDGSTFGVQRQHLASVDFAPDAADRWALELTLGNKKLRMVDGDALRVGAMAMAARNEQGADDRELQSAIAQLEWLKGPEGMRRYAAESGGLRTLTHGSRLAIEMAFHEDAERRAMEGELAELQYAWHEAEQLASIADNLLIPNSVSEWLRAQRRDP